MYVRGGVARKRKRTVQCSVRLKKIPKFTDGPTTSSVAQSGAARTVVDVGVAPYSHPRRLQVTSTKCSKQGFVRLPDSSRAGTGHGTYPARRSTTYEQYEHTYVHHAEQKSGGSRTVLYDSLMLTVRRCCIRTYVIMLTVDVTSARGQARSPGSGPGRSDRDDDDDVDDHCY